MKCVFIIHQQMSTETLERQYLLMIAMLNFDFEVHLLFTSGAGSYWRHHPQWQKKLKALDMYGISSIKQLPDTESTQHPLWYSTLLAEADFIS